MPDDAARLIQGELARRPLDPELHALLGRTNLARRDYAGADSAFRKACMLDTAYVPTMVAAFVGEGRARLASGEIDQARWTLGRAAETDPTARARIADTCVAVGVGLIGSDPERASEVFSLATAFAPNVNVRIGEAWIAAGKRVLATDPARGEAALDRGVRWAPDLAHQAGQAVANAMQHADATTRERLTPLVGRFGEAGRTGFMEQSGPARVQKDIEVQPSLGWTASRFELHMGDTLRLEPSGSVRAEANREGWISEACGPAGWPAQSMEWLEQGPGRLPAPTLPRMGLIARVGGAKPFGVPGPLRYVATGSGLLEFAVNDFSEKSHLARGRFRVAVDALMRALKP